MFAALTNAVSDSAMRRRRGCSSSSTFGVTTNRPISSAPSSDGTSQSGPAVRRPGSSTCTTIASSTVSCAGQNGLAVGRRRIGAGVPAAARLAGAGGCSATTSEPTAHARRVALALTSGPAREPSRARRKPMGIESPAHLIFIAVVALIVLGPKRLPDLARSLGHGIREFRQSLEDGANRRRAAAQPDGASSPTPAPRRRRRSTRPPRRAGDAACAGAAALARVAELRSPAAGDCRLAGRLQLSRPRSSRR